MYVSVPLRGFMFPSPYGDYGSYQEVKRELERRLASFPSPYGDYGSYRRN